jgi:HEAT repeat protein
MAEALHADVRLSPVGWLLRSINLRAEESGRTVWLFGFVVLFAIGTTWFEAGSVALFLGEHGAAALPWVYMATAVLGSAVGAILTALERWLPPRVLLIGMPLLMTLPLLLLWWLMSQGQAGSPVALAAIVALLRLWSEVVTLLFDQSNGIAANFLFNIRELKRAYPIVSSGVLLADVISGFTLPLLVGRFGTVTPVLGVAAGIMILATGLLTYVGQRYHYRFPTGQSKEDLAPGRRDGTRLPWLRWVRRSPVKQMRGTLRRYSQVLICFFVLAQLLLILVEFQFFNQLDQRLDSIAIARFLGIFSGVLGVVELLTQWFLASRILERWGVFVTAALLPVLSLVIGLGVLQGSWLFVGLVALKFFDELLRYTLGSTNGTVLFQPIPESVRARVQGWRSIAEPLAVGCTGGLILASLSLGQWLDRLLAGAGIQSLGGLIGTVTSLDRLLLVETLIASGLWLLGIWALQRDYVALLVLSAGRGELTVKDAQTPAFRQAILQRLRLTLASGDPKQSSQRLASLELLYRIYPEDAASVIAPLLLQLPPDAQQRGLEILLEQPSASLALFLPQVEPLLSDQQSPKLRALALRYSYLALPDRSFEPLINYLGDPSPYLRGSSAALLLQLGDRDDKTKATHVLRQMLTHPQEGERILGCRALADVQYLQILRLLVPDLLRDPSMAVRRAMLRGIAVTRLEEHYPDLIEALAQEGTRVAAQQALALVGNDLLPPLLDVARNPKTKLVLRSHAWQAIGGIGTTESFDLLVESLGKSWGPLRHKLLLVLIKLPQEAGINATLDRLGQSGIDDLIQEEISVIGQLNAALVDIPVQSGGASMLWRQALLSQQNDAIERLFLFLRLLYPPATIRTAAQAICSGRASQVARGIEILDNIVTLTSKPLLLAILDSATDREKLYRIASLIYYQPLEPLDRLRRLLGLALHDHLEDWALACCFGLAREQQWLLYPEHVLEGLHHSNELVQIAATEYILNSPPAIRDQLRPTLEAEAPRQFLARLRPLWHA